MSLDHITLKVKLEIGAFQSFLWPVVTYRVNAGEEGRYTVHTYFSSLK